MKNQLFRSLPTLLATVLLIAGPSLHAQVTVDAVVATDERQPAPAGALQRIDSPPVAGGAEPIYLGYVNDDTRGSERILSGYTTLVAAESTFGGPGDPAPGTGGAFIINLLSPYANALGEIAFGSSVTGGMSDFGIWTRTTAGGIELVAANGFAAPGTTGSFGGLEIRAFNDAAQVAVTGSVTGAPIGFGDGIWAGEAGALQLVAREGSQAPGFPVGVTYFNFEQVLLNAAGEVAFYASPSSPSPFGGISNTALFVGAPGALQVVAKTGDPAPGIESGVFLTPSGNGFGLNTSGAVAFITGLHNDVGSPAGNGQALYAGRPGALQLVARTRVQAPDVEAGTTLDGLGTVAINAAGEVFFSGHLKTGEPGSKEALWVGRPGQLRLLARVGGDAPETGGAKFIAFDSSGGLLSDSGQVAFLGYLDGGSTGLFATDQLGVVRLMARTGSSVDGSPLITQLRIHPQPGSAQSRTANGDGRQSSIDASGRLFFLGTWSEPGGAYFGRDAIFLATFAASAPVIPPQGQPASVRGVLGGSATFQVTALGSRPATYQWRVNGADISGATAPELTLTNLTEADRGIYTVLVTNAQGSLESAPAALTFPPVITTQPRSRSFGAGSTATLTVAATGPGTLTYQWQHRAVGAQDFADVPGANAPTLTLPNVAPGATGRYRVIVSNADGTTTSAEAALTIAPAGRPIIESLVFSGDPAPALGSDVFLGGGVKGVLNNHGDVAFESGLVDRAGAPLFFAGVFGGTPGDYRLFYRDAFNANLGDSGEAVMRSNLLSGSSESNNGSLHGAPGNVQILAREAQPAPGTNTTFKGDGVSSINASGTAAFVDAIAGLFIGEPGTLQSIAEIGDPAPGLGAGVTFAGIGGGGELAFNDAGTAAFTANVQGTGISENNDEGIWLGSTSSVQRVVAEGAAAPGGGAGAVFGSFLAGPNINGTGEITFTSQLAGTANAEAIHAGAPATLTLVARVGATYSGHEMIELHDSLITTPLINAAGQVAFGAFVEPVGTSDFRQSIWRWTPGAGGGTRQLIVRAGQQAPGCPAGVVFGSTEFTDPFFTFAMNATGQIAFKAFVTGPGVNETNRNHEGLWMTTPSGEVKLVARLGDPFDIGGGVMKTLELVLLPIYASGGEDGQPRYLSEAGEFVFTAQFDNFNSSGIFRATVQGSGGGGPVATTGAATGIAQTAATLNGTVNPSGAEALVHFEYGTTTSYGDSTPVQTVPAGTSAVNITANISGLQPGMLYHFRLVATNPSGTSQGADATFMTNSEGNQPPGGGTIVLSPSFGITPGSPLTVTLEGWSDPENNTPLTYLVLVDGQPSAPAGTGKVVRFPAPATEGPHIVTARISDLLGAFTEVALNFIVVAEPPAPVTTVLVAGGGALPPGSGAPAGSTWSSFGAPTALASDVIGFRARVRAPDGRFTGIFSGPSTLPVLRLATGDPAPNATGAPLPGASFESFNEPLFTSAENIAILATLRGVPKGANSGLWARTGGTLRLVAGEGDAAADVAGATYKSVLLAGMADETVFFTAVLRGAGKTGSRGLWVWDQQNGARSVFREGASVELPNGGTRTLRAFSALTPRVSSPGEPGVLNSSIAVLLTFNDDGQAHGRVLATGEIEIEALTGVTAPGTLFALEFSMPDLLDDATGFAVLAALSESSVAIVTADGVLAQTGTLAPGTSAQFKRLHDPVIGSPGSPFTAFFGVVKGSGASKKNDTGVWFQPAGGALTLLAREGTAAPNSGGATFNTFTSLAIVPGRGPAFVAKLKPNTGTPSINPGNDTGLWSVTSGGSVRALLRDGDAIGGKTLRSFTALSFVPGSPAQERNFHSGEELIYRAVFTDNSEALVKVEIP